MKVIICQRSYCLFTFILYENINLNPTFFNLFFEVLERFELPYQTFAEPDFTCQTQHHVVEPVGNDPTPQDFQSRAITLSAIVPFCTLAEIQTPILALEVLCPIQLNDKGK